MQAVITIGAPGSGKSLHAQSLVTGLGYQEINRDNARLAITGQIDDHSNEAKVTAYCYAQIAQAGREGRDIVISDTNLNYQFRADLLAHLAKCGYESVTVVTFDVPLPELLRRNESRDKPVPEHAIKRMHHDLVLLTEGLVSPDSY